MLRLRRELAALNMEINSGEEYGMPTDAGEDGTAVMFSTVRYAILKSLYAKQMVRLMDEREDYELWIWEKTKLNDHEGPF